MSFRRVFCAYNVFIQFRNRENDEEVDIGEADEQVSRCLIRRC
jgi:hypothetical protein